MHNFEVFRLPFHLGCLDRLQIEHEEKTFRLHDGRVGLHLGGVFFVTFKLPFHALPLLSPHPASFRSLVFQSSCWIFCSGQHLKRPRKQRPKADQKTAATAEKNVGRRSHGKGGRSRTFSIDDVGPWPYKVRFRCGTDQPATNYQVDQLLVNVTRCDKPHNQAISTRYLPLPQLSI